MSKSLEYHRVELDIVKAMVMDLASMTDEKQKEYMLDSILTYIEGIKEEL